METKFIRETRKTRLKLIDNVQKTIMQKITKSKEMLNKELKESENFLIGTKQQTFVYQNDKTIYISDFLQTKDYEKLELAIKKLKQLKRDFEKIEKEVK